MDRNIDKYWEKYSEIYSFEIFLRKFRERKAIECLEARQPKNILEIGCGFTPLFLKYEEFDNYTVIEPGRKAALFLKNLIKENKKISLINDYFEDCSEKLKGKIFDYIICDGVLHEINKPEIFLKEIEKLMGSDTAVYINVPNAKSIHRIIAKSMGLIKNVYEKSERNLTLQINKNYDMFSLQKLIIKIMPKVEILECESFFIKPFTHDQMMDCIKNDILNEEVVEGLYSASSDLPGLGCELFCFFEQKIN